MNTNHGGYNEFLVFLNQLYLREIPGTFVCDNLNELPTLTNISKDGGFTVTVEENQIHLVPPVREVYEDRPVENFADEIAELVKPVKPMKAKKLRGSRMQDLKRRLLML